MRVQPWFLMVLLLLTLLSAVPVAAQSDQPDSEPVDAGQTAATTYFISFQGRLLTPGTGVPKPDAVYPMVFRIYTAFNTPVSDAAWSESKNIATVRGVFNTMLGDTTALNLGIFNGQDLWLGMSVSGEEMSPRQQLAYTPYSLYAASAGNATTLAGNAPSAFAAASHAHDGSAITSGVVSEPRIDPAIARDSEVGALAAATGLLAPATHEHAGSAITSGTVAEARIDSAIARDSEVGALAAATGLLAPATHEHAGSAITSGTVAEARIDPAIARDSEIVPLVTSIGAFAPTSHTHSGAAIITGTVAAARIDAALARDAEVMPIVLSNDGAGSTLDADTLDGLDGSSFSLGGHNHLGETWSGTDSLVINGGGDALKVSASDAGVRATGGNSGFYSVGSNYGLNVENAAVIGMYVGDANTGAYVNNATTGAIVNNATTGVRVLHALNNGMEVDDADNNGFLVTSAGSNGLYVGDAAGAGVQINQANTGFSVSTATGTGLYVGNVGSDGVYVANAAGSGLWVTNAGANGLRVNQAGYGVSVLNANQTGFSVDTAGGNGLEVNQAGLDGVKVGNAIQSGVTVNQAGNTGVYVGITGSNGFEVVSAVGDGLEVEQAGEHGVYVGNAGYSGFTVLQAALHGVAVIQAAQNGLYVGNAGANGVEVNWAAGTGVSVAGAGSNAFRGITNNAVSTVLARNNGTGRAVDGYSLSGVPGWFTTYNNDDILVAEEEVTLGGPFDVRFRVKRWGEVRADGNYYGLGGYFTGNADFAEMLPAVTGLMPGDVLVIGADGKLQRSTAANATSLAGVYSTQPGFLGGVSLPTDQQVAEKLGGSSITASDSPSSTIKAEIDARAVTQAQIEIAYETDGEIPLAIVGVVPVKVTAANGAIQPGDLLTTSSLAGHAMTALPVDVGGVQIYRPATIIGKALEPLASGTGVITVLLAMQ